MGLIKNTLGLTPAVPPTDIVARELWLKFLTTNQGVVVPDQVIPLDPAATSYDALLEDGLQVEARVRDQDNAGNWGDWSPSFVFTSMDLSPLPPAAPTIGSISANGLGLASVEILTSLPMNPDPRTTSRELDISIPGNNFTVPLAIDEVRTVVDVPEGVAGLVVSRHIGPGGFSVSAAANFTAEDTAAPPKPAAPTLTSLSEDNHNVVTVTLGLTAPAEADHVASRNVVVTVVGSGVPGTVLNVSPPSLTTIDFPVVQGTQLSVAVQDSDAAGNVSPFSDPLEVVAADVTAPPEPGGVTILGSAEVAPDQIAITVGLPPLADGTDVVKRHIHNTMGYPTYQYWKTTVDVAVTQHTFVVPENGGGTIYLQDEDESGNLSLMQWNGVNWYSHDTTPPGQPGPVTLQGQSRA